MAEMKKMKFTEEYTPKQKFDRDYLYPPIKNKYRNIYLTDGVLLTLI